MLPPQHTESHSNYRYINITCNRTHESYINHMGSPAMPFLSFCATLFGNTKGVYWALPCPYGRSTPTEVYLPLFSYSGAISPKKYNIIVYTLHTKLNKDASFRNEQTSLTLFPNSVPCRSWQRLMDQESS